MSAQSIERPGETVEGKTLAELLQFDESTDVAVEWRQQMSDIDQSQRSAENEEASVRIR